MIEDVIKHIRSDLTFPSQKLCYELSLKQKDKMKAIELQNKTYLDVTERIGSAKDLICKCPKGDKPIRCEKYYTFMDAKWMVTYLELQNHYQKEGD